LLIEILAQNQCSKQLNLDSRPGLVDIRFVMSRNVLVKPYTFLPALLTLLFSVLVTPSQELTVSDVQQVISRAVSKADRRRPAAATAAGIAIALIRP